MNSIFTLIRPLVCCQPGVKMKISSSWIISISNEPARPAEQSEAPQLNSICSPKVKNRFCHWREALAQGWWCHWHHAARWQGEPIGWMERRKWTPDHQTSGRLLQAVSRVWLSQPGGGMYVYGVRHDQALRINRGSWPEPAAEASDGGSRLILISKLNLTQRKTCSPCHVLLISRNTTESHRKNAESAVISNCPVLSALCLKYRLLYFAP